MRHVVTALLLVATSSAWAWNGAGHRLVAAIAWRQMSPPAREAVASFLAAHPDFRRWTRRAVEEPAYVAFLEAAVWADDIKKDVRFSEQGESLPAGSCRPDSGRHRDWHYVDRTPDGQRRSGELDIQLKRLIRCLKSHHASLEEKAYALPWILHLVGDIHQPLHVGTRDDEGGNNVEIEDPFNSRQPFTNLHAWWDDLPGPPWLRGERLEAAAEGLLEDYPTPPRQGSVALWEKESRELGRDRAYPPATGSLLPAISEDFRTWARQTARRRLAEAGYRLGRLLDEALGPVPRETK